MAVPIRVDLDAAQISGEIVSRYLVGGQVSSGQPSEILKVLRRGVIAADSRQRRAEHEIVVLQEPLP